MTVIGKRKIASAKIKAPEVKVIGIVHCILQLLNHRSCSILPSMSFSKVYAQIIFLSISFLKFFFSQSSYIFFYILQTVIESYHKIAL